ncbi:MULTISPECIES: helix-turn-helix transcriptional regulator [unclassified Streptomyces]|uniref:helix-turn-helix domain-containing protein n=1 Tax=unclassified Streptomyces TaxID=2593676 RepID=UPI00073BF78F|nr:helix-turn-helix transcriptional regulator [Streptomyces sp. AVP053U2]ODA71094.1 putative HTH-type transcriptional regulator [Streptomyces sp. AVP053U2]
MTGQTTRGPAPLRYRAGPRRQALAALLDGLRTDGGARVVTGEPGGGRTAFLKFAARSFCAGPVWYVRAEPAWSPHAQPHSGLHTLLRAAGHAGRLPGDGTAGGETLLDILRAASARSPLLVCVDDAHLWDTASRAALGRVAARVHAAEGVHRVGLLVSVPGHRPVGKELAGLPVLELAPLTPGDAAGLLHDLTDGAVDPVVRDELVTEAQGNPALLLALAHRLSPAQLRGDRSLPHPLADAVTLAAVAGGCPGGRRPDRAGLLLTVAAAMRATGEQDAEAALVRRATNGCSGREGDGRPPPSEPPKAPELVAVSEGRLRFRSPLLGRALYAGAPPERRRAAHRALAAAHPDPHGVPALLHRSWTALGPDAALAARLERAVTDPTSGIPSSLRRTAQVRAAELTPDDAQRARRYTAAAQQALLAGHPREALRLLDAAGSRPAPAPVRGRAELLRGRVLLADGPVDDARESFLLAARLLVGPSPAEADAAVLGAADAAWAAGDRQACLRALAHDDASADPAVAGLLDLRAAAAATPGPQEAVAREALRGGPSHRGAAVPAQPSVSPSSLLRDDRDGMRAVLLGRFDLAAAPLTRVVDRGRPATDPERLLRSVAAALMLGDVVAARRGGARALAAARTLGAASLEPRALEYLAYAELRAGCHQLARTHAEEGLRAARRTGQRNTAAHHHAVLALAASIESDRARVTGHAAAALTTARRHGLAQAFLLAQWAAARADLGAGRPEAAADRLGPLVRPGARRGHFALWMLAAPCFVEAAALAGRSEHARAVVEDFALWTGCGADPQAPAQLLRCRALLAAPEDADELYLRALQRHDETSGDFERARTGLLHGKWLRRRRRLREARARLGEALVDFERCGAQLWARQTAAELRANGVAPNGPGTGEAPRHGARDLSRLTPQQLRIARCVAEGATNREVALSLSVSTRTVDYHLRNVFATLGVRSRVELVRLVEQAEKTGAQL